MNSKPCYLRCGIVRVSNSHPIRLKYIDTGISNWCASPTFANAPNWFTSGTRCFSDRKQLLDSKSRKRLQELNLALDKRVAELDDERATLAKTLQNYSKGIDLENTLHAIRMELAALEAQDTIFRQQLARETEKLDQLERKVDQSRFTHSNGLAYMT